MSTALGASDENLIQKSDEDSGGGKLPFFDNTIDESENDSSVESPVGDVKKSKEPEKVKPDEAEAGQSGKEKNVLTGSKSFMEIEVKKDKMRWLYMSELGAIFGEEKHTREGFIKLFGTRVSCEEEIK